MSDEKVETPEVPSKPKTKKSKAEIAAPVVELVKNEKLYSFEQWAARRGIPAQHRGGRRAYVKNANRARSLEAWDDCFSGY